MCERYSYDQKICSEIKEEYSGNELDISKIDYDYLDYLSIHGFEEAIHIEGKVKFGNGRETTSRATGYYDDSRKVIIIDTLYNDEWGYAEEVGGNCDPEFSECKLLNPCILVMQRIKDKFLFKKENYNNDDCEVSGPFFIKEFIIEFIRHGNDLIRITK